MEIKIVGQTIVYDGVVLKRVKRYLQGSHPQRGSITNGHTGIETVEEIDVFVPKYKFEVKDPCDLMQESEVEKLQKKNDN